VVSIQCVKCGRASSGGIDRHRLNRCCVSCYWRRSVRNRWCPISDGGGTIGDSSWSSLHGLVEFSSGDDSVMVRVNRVECRRHGDGLRIG
jgi:hypothetical protein